MDWYKTLSSSRFFVDNQAENAQWCKIFRKRIFKDNADLLDDWLVGKITTHDILSRVSRNEAEYQRAFDLLKRSCEKMQFDSERFLPLIKKLRSKGYKVVVATDNMDVFTKYAVPALKLDKYFDGVISSAELGITKKEIINGRLPFFDSFLNVYGESYENAFLFDDRPDIINQCQIAGLSGKCINCPEDLEDGLAKLAECG